MRACRGVGGDPTFPPFPQPQIKGRVHPQLGGVYIWVTQTCPHLYARLTAAKPHARSAIWDLKNVATSP